MSLPRLRDKAEHLLTRASFSVFQEGSIKPSVSSASHLWHQPPSADIFALGWGVSVSLPWAEERGLGYFKSRGWGILGSQKPLFSNIPWSCFPYNSYLVSKWETINQEEM